MGKEFQERGNNNNRGGGSGRGRGGDRPRFNNNRGGDQGPPSYVIPYGTFLHKSQNNFVVKCTDMTRFPKFNRGVYLQNKSKVGSVDQILGPINAFYFSVKPAQGVTVSNFKAGQIFYMSPEDLLSTDKFTKPFAPRPKVPRPAQGFSRPQGGRGGGSFQGGRGGFGQGNRGGFGQGNRGGFGGRGGNNFRGR